MAVVAVAQLAGDGGDQCGDRVGVEVSTVDARAAAGGEQVAGQCEHGGEADRVWADVQIDRGGHGEAYEGVTDRE